MKLSLLNFAILLQWKAISMKPESMKPESINAVMMPTTTASAAAPAPARRHRFRGRGAATGAGGAVHDKYREGAYTVLGIALRTAYRQVSIPDWTKLFMFGMAITAKIFVDRHLSTSA
jgi:hypothetical protein